MILSPEVYKKIKSVVFTRLEPSVTTVFWARPSNPEGNGFDFFVYDNGEWQLLNQYENVIIPKVDAHLSAFINDVGYLTEHQDISGKQDVISDLATIRSGAAAGATAYQKPQEGIPSTDMLQGVQTSLGKADTSLQPTQQTLTDAQKQQARDNIDAAGKDDVPTLPDNVSYFSNDSGEGIIPIDGIRGEEITAAAEININPEVVTFITGEIGSNTNITLTVHNDALWHVWDMFLTTAADGGATIVVPTGAALHVPSGYSIVSGKTYEIRVIGKGLNYYLAYGEFA